MVVVIVIKVMIMTSPFIKACYVPHTLLSIA